MLNHLKVAKTVHSRSFLLMKRRRKLQIKRSVPPCSFQELGDVKFVINVGDSFYPTGVTSKTDEQWGKKWRGGLFLAAARRSLVQRLWES